MGDLSSELMGKRSFTERTFSPLTPNGVRSTIMVFSAGILGAGLLSLPYAFGACGVGGGSLLLIIVWVCYFCFYSELVGACDRTKVFTYPGVMEAHFGHMGRLLFEVTLLFDTIGTLALMDALLQQFGLFSMKELGLLETDSQTVRVVFLLVIVLCVQLPLVIPEEIHSLRFSSSLSVLAVLYLALIVVLQTPQYLEHRSTSIELFKLDWKTVDAAGIILFAFSNPQLVPMLYCDLERRSPARMGKVMFRTFGMMGMLYFLVGVCGYISYADHMPDIVTHRPSLDGGVDYLMLIGRAVYLITIVVQTPFTLYPARLAMQQFYKKNDSDVSAIRYYAVTLVLLMIPTVISLAVPEVLVYFKVLGTILPVLLGIIYPSKHYAVMVSLASASLTLYRGCLIVFAAAICCFAFTSLATLLFPSLMSSS